MKLRLHLSKAMLGVEHHLLICPLGELGIGLVHVRGGWRELGCIEGLGWGLLLELRLIKGGIERGGVY